ncbi:MAG: alcohol dehydrogenase catalytic domain-containing protein [Caldilineaceae bacterium]|nr:alcohol dehydrogenase catalytic domain-containing protein [Caldilineaceae bacterium]
MRALLKETPEPGLTLREIDEPQIAAQDDVKFRVEYCAICVGETKVYDWNGWAASDTTLKLPTVLGHEVAGVVTEVAAGVTHFRPGDRITVDPLIHCGDCRPCRSGHTNMCDHREIYGKRRGAFAEFAVLPERVICKLPDRLSLEEGSLLENLGVAVHAVEIAPHDPGDTAVVIGCGPIGLMAGQSLAAMGVNVVLTDLVDARLEFADQIGVGRVVDVKREDPVAVVGEMTEGRGADFVLEAAATQSALDQAFDLVRTLGTVVTIGTFDQPVTFNPFFRMTRREIKFLSTMGRTWETWRRMVQLVESGRIDLKPYVTHVLPLEEFDRGFELVKSYGVQKVLLKL